MKDVAQRETELMQQPSPYKLSVQMDNDSIVKKLYRKVVPNKVRRVISKMRRKNKFINFILED